MKRQIKLAKELFEVALPNIRNAKKVTEDPRILIFRMFDTEKNMPHLWLMNLQIRQGKYTLF